MSSLFLPDCSSARSRNLPKKGASFVEASSGFVSMFVSTVKSSQSPSVESSSISDPKTTP